MIHVVRGPAPSELRSPAIGKAKRRTASLRRKSKSELGSQARHDFQTDLIRTRPIQDALATTFNRKCAYCETLLQKNSATVDAFRPKEYAVGLSGDRSPNHYWWLAYEWSNLYFSCAYCNKFKGQRFPVKGKRAPVEGSVEMERRLLLDPCADFPEDHFVFDENGLVTSQTEQGRITIDVLGLNRSKLQEDRKRTVTLLQKQWKIFVSSLRTMKKSIDATSDSSAEESVRKMVEELYTEKLDFLSLRRQFLQQWSLEAIEKQPHLKPFVEDFLAFRTAIKKQLAPDTEPAESSIADVVKHEMDPASKIVLAAVSDNVRDFQASQASQENYSLSDTDSKQDYFRKARFIERIEIRNFKVIEQLDLQVKLNASEKGSWLLLLGENGMGKSSILQAISLALCGDEARILIGVKDASRYVKYGKSSGYVRIFLTGTSEPVELKFKLGSKEFETNTPSPKILLLAYGATRLAPRPEARLVEGSPYTRPFNLFSPYVALKDPNKWLLKLWDDKDPAPFNEAATVVKQLFLLNGKDRLSKDDELGAITINGPTLGKRIPLTDLSAGYESVLALLTDIVGTLSELWESMDSAEGLVLIDEIDAHLHPRWKMAIIPRLRTCFPQVQFIVTSHEPLTLRSLKAAEIAILDKDKKGKVFAITEDLPEPRALRIDQLLTSEFFGMSSTIDFELQTQYEEYYKLLGKQKRTKAENARVAELKKDLDKYQQFGTTERERVMLEAADEFVAKRRAQSGEKKPFKKATQKLIADLWKDF